MAERCQGGGKNCDLVEKHLQKVEAAQERATQRHGRMKDTDYVDLKSVRRAKCKGKCSDTNPAGLCTFNK